MNYYWPIGILVIANVFYHLSTKSVPEGLNPFAAMVATYIIAAIVSLILYFILSPEKNLAVSLAHANWSTIMLGFSIVGLEIGAIYMYKVGWDISIGNLVQSSIVTVFLVIIGIIIFKEAMTISRAAGIVLCAVGLFFINK